MKGAKRGMQAITKWAFKNRAAMIIVVLMALVMGVVSYFRLPMEFLPEADNPQVTVAVIGQGYDAKSMETQVTAKLEEALQFTKGKTTMESTTGNGFSQVNLNFDSDTNMKDAKAEIERAAAAVQLPENVSAPYVVQFNTSMIPISLVTFAFDANMSKAEREEAEKKIVNDFKKIDGAGEVSLSGKSQPTVSIVPDTKKLAEKGIPVQALMGVLQNRSAQAAVGEKDIAGESSNINVSADIADIETLRKLQVAPGIALGDVAEVKLSEQQDSISSLAGKDVLMLSISKTANANAVSVGKDAEALADKINEEMKGVEAKVLLSTADQVVHSVNSMMREVLMGALFATIVILLFMRNIRATLVTIVSIPLSLGITLYLLHASGVTLNIITLGGVAVAVGRLVDDSIVVIENIYRRLQKESFSPQLIIDSTKEVASAITSSTLVTVAVFMPLGLLGGSLKAFLLPFALTVTYSLLASLLVALTVVPLLSAVFLRGTRMVEHEGSKRFSRFLTWNLKHKWVPLLIAGLLFFGSIGAYFAMPKAALDSSSAESLNVTLEYPSKTPHAQVLENGRKLEKTLNERNEVEWVLLSNGNSADNAKFGQVSSPTLVTYNVQMKDGADAEKVIEAVKAERANYAGAELNASAASMMGGGGSTSVTVDIVGDDATTLEDGAAQVMAAIQPVKDVLKVKSNQEEKKSVYTFALDPVKAKGAEIASQLQALLNPIPVGAVSLEGRQTMVILQPSVNPASEADLNGLTVMADSGPVAVSAIAKLTQTEEATTFYHKDGKPYIRVTAEVEPSRLSVVGAEITKKVDALQAPEGVEFVIGGASAQQANDFADLGMTALISIGIVYLIMVITFRTLRAPLAIMFSLPLAAIGAIVGLLVSGISPDFTAMFGALMLVGIVVTNAIVLIDRVKQNEETMTVRDALVEAASTRMRPILMTAVATICAMLPLVFGSAESGSIVSQSLAIVVIGGLTVATVLTLVIVPVVYELFFFRKSRRERRAASRIEHAA